MKISTYIEALCSLSKKRAPIEPKSAYELANQALNLAVQFKLTKWEGYALFHMAYACRVMSDYANGLTLSFKALDIFETIDDIIGLCKVRNIIGIVYFYYGAYSDAHEHFLVALDLLKEQDDYNVESSVLNNLGEVYREAGENDQALVYYHKALVITMKHQLAFNTAAILLNIGEIKYQRKHYNTSTDYVKRAYDIVLKEGYVLEQGESESKLGRAMVAIGDYTAARQYFVSALAKFEKVSNKYYLVDLLIEMAILDETMGMNPIKNFIEALETAQNANLEKKVSIIYKHMATYYEQQLMFDKALEFFKKYHYKMAEIEASNLSKRLEILSVEFEYYKQKSEDNQFKQLTEKLSREVAMTRGELESIKENNQSLRYETLIDELTQVFNRRGIQHQLSEWFKTELTFMGAVYLMDIDRFKQYNDEWGHIKGDHCLMQVASAINELPHKDYFIGRYGGDEFIAFAKVNSYDDAQTLGEHFRTCMTNIGDMGSVTLSVGCYFGKLDEAGIWNRIDQADMQLYKAKESGRNNLMVTTDE